MRISPLDHCKVPSGLELSSKPHATGMSCDPLQKVSRRTRPVDFVCCPIELGKAKRLAVLSGKVLEAVEHGKLHLSVGVIWRREHVCPAHIHPLRPWPVVRPVGFYGSTYKDGRPPPPESRHVLRTTPTVTQGWAVELVQHPHRDDMACPIGPRLQMLRNIHNVLVRIYARSRRRSSPQVAEGVLRLFGPYL